MYVGTRKFIFQGLLANTREPVTAPMRRAMWRIATDQARDYLARIERDWCSITS